MFWKLFNKIFEKYFKNFCENILKKYLENFWKNISKIFEKIFSHWSESRSRAWQFCNFWTVWATEMAKYKKWYYSSPETHLYYQKNKLHSSSALKSFWVGGWWHEIITSALLLFLLKFESQIWDIDFKGVFWVLTLTRLERRGSRSRAWQLKHL